MATELQVKVYGGLLPVARRKAHARPLGLWTMARAQDRAGSGVVDLAELHTAAAAYFTRATFYRTVTDGARLGFWRIIDRASGARVLVLTGLEALAEAQGISNVGSAPFVVSAARLVGAAAIRAAHYAALVSCHSTHTPTNAKMDKAIGALRKLAAATDDADERAKLEKLEKVFKSHRHYAAPISQRALTELGAPGRRTQSRYKGAFYGTSTKAGIRARRNMARTGQSAAHLTGARENLHGGYFIWGGALVRRLPNNYSSNLPRASASYVRKVNRSLSPLLECGDGVVQERRLFFTSDKQAERATSELQFIRSKRSYSGTRIWDEKRPENAWELG